MPAKMLHHEQVTAPGASPDAWLYMLHGIFGAGRNWRTIAGRLVRERVDWGALLVDLREHGASQGFSRPHTIAAAAADLAVLAATARIAPAALLGHSFGGKAALAFARSASPALRQLWLVDSTPAAREPGGSAWRMLRTIRALPAWFDTRESLMEALEREGFARPIAQWMATNLEARDGRFEWRFDIDALEALLRDFFVTDLFDVVETPPAGTDVHVVRATRGSVLTGAALARIERAAADGRLQLHVVEGGHWLNADNPNAIVDLLRRHLPPA